MGSFSRACQCFGTVTTDCFSVDARLSTRLFNKAFLIPPRRSLFGSMGATSSSSVSTPEEAASLVNRTIQDNKVAIFSKTTCPHCSRVKKLFADLSVSPFYVELNQRSDELLIKDVLVNLTGGRSVPRVFVGGQFVGGADDTMALHRSGELTEKLKAAGVL